MCLLFDVHNELKINLTWLRETSACSTDLRICYNWDNRNVITISLEPLGCCWKNELLIFTSIPIEFRLLLIKQSASSLSADSLSEILETFSYRCIHLHFYVRLIVMTFNYKQSYVSANITPNICLIYHNFTRVCIFSMHP